jgi:predicted metal-dependent hydrolase
VGSGKVRPPRGVRAGRAAQLAFGFSGDELEDDASGSPVASAPTRPEARIVRSATAARQVRLGDGLRPDEELRLEGAVGGMMPPGKRLSLRLTENRYTMISVRRKPEGYVVRAHRMFSGAEPRVVRALARYVVHNDPRASALLGDYIERNQHVIKQQPRRRRAVKLRTRGRFHDLQRIFDRLNEDSFAGKLEAKITWGPAVKRRGRRKSIKMGSFAVEDRIIRIHPALDRADVPEYFVAWIVFHEMLHGKHEATRVGTRRCYHTKAFAAEERSFHDYERAVAWERAHIDSLLVG